MDLGRTFNAMYPSSPDKEKKHYQRVSLPKTLFGDKKLSLDDVHSLKIKAKIVGHDPESKTVDLELAEGEVEGSSKEKTKEGETVLGKAK